MYKVGATKAELQPLCDAFAGCIAFSEAIGQDYGRLYFSSVDAALAADAPRGWEKWTMVSGRLCTSDCDVARAARGGGGCWTVRVPATRTIAPRFSGHAPVLLDMSVVVLLCLVVARSAW